jgi:pimeloyl-ACP methyl ester carboxylesterase
VKLRRDGVEIGYEIGGSGPAILFLHAFPVDKRMWHEAAAELQPRFRTIAMDMRGFGDSTGAAPSLETVADDAAALLDALGVPMAAVCGLSMGGYLALAFAERHVARLGALILADTRAAADSPEARKNRDAGIATLRERGTAPFAEPMIPRLLSPPAGDAVRARVRELSAQRPEALAAALAAMRDRPDRSETLRTLDCPTLLLCGSDDALSPPIEMRALAHAVPGAQLVELPHAGHLSAMENPAAFARAIEEFLDQL